MQQSTVINLGAVVELPSFAHSIECFKIRPVGWFLRPEVFGKVHFGLFASSA